MAKFAILDENDVVENIVIAEPRIGMELGIYCDDYELEIGDSFDRGKALFYRGEVEVEPMYPKLITLKEDLQKIRDTVDYLLVKQEELI